MAYWIDGKEFLLADKTLDGLDRAALRIRQGGMKVHDWVIFSRAARRAACLDAPLFVEIGVQFADTTLALFRLLDAENGPSIAYLGIDPSDVTRKAWEEKIAATTWRHKAELKTAYSVDVAPSIADESVAFLFVDGCHCAACVEADIRAWLPKVRRGGFVIFHDDNPELVGHKMSRIYPHRRDGVGVATAIANTEALRAELGFALWSQSRTDPKGAKRKPQPWLTIYRRQP